MIFIEKIRKRYRAWRLKRAIKNIRETFGWFGYDLNMSDEELIRRLRISARFLNRAYRKLGISVEQAALGLSELASISIPLDESASKSVKIVR